MIAPIPMRNSPHHLDCPADGFPRHWPSALVVVGWVPMPRRGVALDGDANGTTVDRDMLARTDLRPLQNPLTTRTRVAGVG